MKEPATSPRAVVTLALIGLLAGLLSGLLGVGGGVVMVPLLVGVVGLSQHSAHATSLAALIPIASVGATKFALEGSVDYRVAGLLAVGALVGAPLGAGLMARIKEGLLKVLFGVLMVGVGVQLLWS